MNKKDFKFQLKSVSEDGTFEGMLSVYNVVDLGNDMVLPGAFTKTIKENSGRVPMLWQHASDAPIGSLELEDRPEGLAVKGRFVLEVEKAREAYALLKENVIRGLSIGYRAIKHEMKAGVRNLQEVQLFEGSVVTFPMLPIAQVTSIKAEGGKDFLEELDMAQTMAMRYMMMSALECSLCDIIWESTDSATALQASEDSINQFHESYMGYLPKLLVAYGMKRDAGKVEPKAGRTISAATRKEIEGAIGALQALLTEEEDTTAEATAKAAEPSREEAATKSNEPEDLHSWLRKGLDRRKKAA